MRLGNNDYRDEDCGDDDCGDDASRVVRASGDADALVRGRFGTNRLTHTPHTGDCLPNAGSLHFYIVS